MAFTPLPFSSTVTAYRRQADDLYSGWLAGDPEAIRVLRTKHPKFLDAKIPWLERRMSDDEVRATPVDSDDALLAVARWYDFLDWASLVSWVDAVHAPGSPVARFEEAVETVIAGAATTLASLLREEPWLVRARSTRVNHFDPPVHRATLLHYLAANGVESYRQRSPTNAVEIARLLLDAGADPNALQDSYGGQNTTMSLLVSSSPPRDAGVQVPLIDVLVDYGATLSPSGRGAWTSPLETALGGQSRAGANRGSLAKARRRVSRHGGKHHLQPTQGLQVTSNQSLLLGSAPSLQLPFPSERQGSIRELFNVDDANWPPWRSKERTSVIVRVQAHIQVVRFPNIQRVIRTPQDIDPMHRTTMPSSFPYTKSPSTRARRFLAQGIRRASGLP